MAFERNTTLLHSLLYYETEDDFLAFSCILTEKLNEKGKYRDAIQVFSFQLQQFNKFFDAKNEYRFQKKFDKW